MQGLVGSVELTIDEERIEERRGPSTISARWAEVQAIEDGRDHVFVRLAPLIAIMIPHRAFDSLDDRQQFVAFVRARLA